ncbi:hypothetical protein [Flagellimonas sp.]|uniref:hypothetical protein n=1 Tax=Flagellimonas sp. TaxID=2058762 RepID=UPI003BAC92E4
MKTSIVYLIIGLLLINSLKAQVKIGNNPQNLHPASVLELESPTRVLVITRVTDAQMSVINPLPGAVVYNTDQDCLHYYNGTQWINICEALDNSFTVSTRPDYFSTINPAQSKDSTVVISQTENPDGSINYNYEVGLIRGANIVNTTINGDSKIQAESITTQLLAPKSVTIGKFADAQGGAAGDIFQWNGSQWTLVNESVLGITEKDSIVGNEVVGPFDSTLTLEGDGDQGNPYTLDVAPLGIDTPELADDAVTNEKINANVAGTGLLQATDGSLEVDNTSIAPDWINIINIPAGFADDIDNDTQLTDAQVATAVNNEFPNLDTDATDDFSGDFGDLTNVPANLDTDSTDDFDGEWSSLLNVPAGFADDIDNDTQLTDAQVATAVNSEFPNLDTDATDDFSGDFGDLTNVPANLDTDSTDDFDGEWSSLLNVPAGFADDIDNDTQLTDAEVATAVNSEFPNLDTDATDDFSGDFGDLTNVPANLDTDSTDDFDGEWSSLLNVPAGFADDIDNDTQLTDAEVATAVNSEFPNLDTDATDDFSGDFGDLTNVPVNLDTDSTDDFDGEWSSLLNVPAGFADDIDNDTTLASMNLIQQGANTDRNYDINSGTLSFTNGSVGVGTTNPPTSTLQTGGSFSAPIRSENAGVVTVTENDYTVIISGTVTDVEIPDPNGIAGRIYRIKNIITGNIPSSRPYFDLSGAGTTFFPNGVTMIQSDGMNWHKINN